MPEDRLGSTSVDGAALMRFTKVRSTHPSSCAAPRFFSRMVKSGLQLTVAIFVVFSTFATAHGQTLEIHNSDGLRVTVDAANHYPALHVVVPGGPVEERSFNIVFPEHVTVRVHGAVAADHLYLYQPGGKGIEPLWKQVGNTLEYAADLGKIRLLARATVVADGILFRYEFVNQSAVNYDMATAITDPRFTSFFYDPRLERTYVHHQEGFDLLASETPERLTRPLKEWLPARYHAQFTTPIPELRVQRRDDGITYYYKSRVVDVPMIATQSLDHAWIAASFSRDPGNVWSNPELTCQHVDPQVVLPREAHATYEVKILIFKGSLDDAYRKVLEQIPSLVHSGSPRLVSGAHGG